MVFAMIQAVLRITFTLQLFFLITLFNKHVTLQLITEIKGGMSNYVAIMKKLFFQYFLSISNYLIIQLYNLHCENYPFWLCFYHNLISLQR